MATPAQQPPRDHPELGSDPLAGRLPHSFSSARLRYRAFEPDEFDTDLMFRINGDPDPYISSSTFWPRPQPRSRAKEATKELAESTKLLLAVCVCIDLTKEQPGLPEELKKLPPAPPGVDKSAADGRDPQLVPVGMLVLRHAFGGFHHHGTELGIDLLADYHGRGYGTEMMRWMLEWAFEMANVHRVGLGCFSWNTKAIRSYEAVGFERCGVEREAVWCAGKYWDHVIYGMLDRDWRRIREERKAKGLR
jgi:RimJ/RimL family protein N-acetyltransferase